MKNPTSSTSKELLQSLATDAERGLDTSVASERLMKFGRNALQSERSRTFSGILLSQFINPMAGLLVLATALSFWFKEYADAIAILAVMMINAFIGAWMDWQGEQSMKALKRLASVPAKVVRNGKTTEIVAEEVVPGDILIVEAGDMVTADARMIQTSQLMTNEASLTGESLPVSKIDNDLPEGTPVSEQRNMLFKGTFITGGNGRAVVVATGMGTELGKIAHLVSSAKRSDTPLEKKLNTFTKRLIYLTVFMTLLIFGVGSLNNSDYLELLKSAIALGVAAIPEGMPIVATLALARGMMRMAKHQVIVKKLAAVETLGGTTVICSDKTGTLTKNKIEVSSLVPTESSTSAEEELMRLGVLCNTATLHEVNGIWKETGDPLETGLLKFAHTKGMTKQKEMLRFPKVNEVPFSSELKMMATSHAIDGGFQVYAKGAAEEILKASKFISLNGKASILDEAIRKQWIDRVVQLSASGLRVIAGARKITEDPKDNLLDDLIFCGLYCMIDPPADGVFEAIQEAKSAGIKVVMITGDHPATADFIASQLKIKTDGGKVITGKEMPAYSDLQPTNKREWANAAVFARVSPAQKLDLVKVLQEQGNIVGMTGDGVNDAPALRQADIGIAMGTRGTQVAQEASDLILKDDAFSSIVHAIKEGRNIFENIRKFVIYMLSCNISELLVISIAALSNLHFQLFPLQILFINLVTDVFPALALAMGRGDDSVMQKLPRNPSDPILLSRHWLRIWIYAVVISCCTLGAVALSYFFVHSGPGFDPMISNNILFFSLIFSQLLHVFNMASTSSSSFFHSSVFMNRNIWMAFLTTGLILLLVFFVTPLREALKIQFIQADDWLIVIAASVLSVILIQILHRIGVIPKGETNHAQ